MGKKKQPKKQDLVKIFKARRKYEKAIEALNETEKEFVDNFGVGKFAYKSKEKFKRVTVRDNLETLKSGEAVFKATSIRPFELKCEELKREPKETKIVK